MPTRNGRNGMIFTTQGIINIRNKKWEMDFSVLDPESPFPEARVYSKAYVRHLFYAGEILGMQLASTQNLHLYLWVVRQAAEQIRQNTFATWKDRMVKKLMERL
jgi:queuine tRNA-ribosyltransferase